MFLTFIFNKIQLDFTPRNEPEQMVANAFVREGDGEISADEIVAPVIKNEA
jgi:hypothetical protein